MISWNLYQKSAVQGLDGGCSLTNFNSNTIKEKCPPPTDDYSFMVDGEEGFTSVVGGGIMTLKLRTLPGNCGVVLAYDMTIPRPHMGWTKKQVEIGCEFWDYILVLAAHLGYGRMICGVHYERDKDFLVSVGFVAGESFKNPRTLHTCWTLIKDLK